MLTDLTLAQAREGLRRRGFSAVELTDAYLAAIEALNPKLNAYVLVTAEAARAHNDANVIGLGARVVGTGVAEAALRRFRATEFAGSRHAGRVDKLDSLLPRS